MRRSFDQSVGNVNETTTPNTRESSCPTSTQAFDYGLTLGNGDEKDDRRDVLKA